MESLFSALGFFTTGMGVLLTLVVGGLIIWFWDRRLSLAGLFIIQVSIATFGVRVHDVSTQWAIAHILIMLLCVLILALSNAQTSASRSMHQPGNWLFRLLAIAIVFLGWRFVNIEVALPAFPANQVRYLISLMLFALLMLSLGDNPHFATVALLLWIIPIQLMVEVLLPEPTLIAFLGLLQLFLALTGGYLILADRIPRAARRVVPTDAVFSDRPMSVALDDDDSVSVDPLPGLPKALLPAAHTDPTSASLSQAGEAQ